MAVIEMAREELDLDRVLDWNEKICLVQFRKLVKKPPLRSVVTDIHPEAAAMILREANSHNRPLSEYYVEVLQATYDKELESVTGDTLKVSKSGILLDGQHRLSLTAKGKHVLRTHIVFGLNDAIFDILDQGRRRTGADALAIDQVTNARQTASAVRWVGAFSEGGRSHPSAANKVMTPRKLRKLVASELRDLPLYAVHGQRVARAHGHPPGMVQALAYLISRHDRKMADQFIADWISGNRDGPNKVFDMLAFRIATVKRQNNNRISAQMRAAYLINVFNAWRRLDPGNPKTFYWSNKYDFPKLLFGGKK